MKTFTINAENGITVHASKKAARETGEGVFSSAEEFSELIGSDNKRLVEIWNSLAGVTPVTKFANRKVATERIWKAIQTLGEAPGTAAAEPEAAANVPETPFDEERTWANCGAAWANRYAPRNSRSSPDQSASARHNPWRSGFPARSSALTAAISRWH